MRAFFFSHGRVSLQERPKPAVAEGEVLVKPALAGICGTDIELLQGYYEFEGIAGHEFVGIIEEAPQRPDLIKQRAVAEINLGCGACTWCRRGDPRHCPERKVLGIKGWDGAFAEYLKAPVKNVRLVEEEISDEEAVFTEPLAAALEISQQIHLQARMKMAVLGDGKLGLLAALALRRYNPGLVLIGRHEKRLKIAQDQGVNTVWTPRDEPFPKLAARLEKFDLVVDATGGPEGIESALSLVRPEGTVVVKTTSRQKSHINLAEVVVQEKTIIGSRCGDFSLALSFLKNRALDVKPLIEAVYPFEEFEKALAHARRPGAGKILLRY